MWASKRQSYVALSTKEAESISVIEATKETIWLQQFLCELGEIQRPIPIYCKNQSAIALVKNPVFHQRTKHIDVRLFRVRDEQNDGSINVICVNTENQLADILAKALPVPRIEKLRYEMGIKSIQM